MKKKTSNRSFAAISLILFLLFSFSNVSAAEWNVGTGQTYTNIQDAIDNANTADGDVINVFSGIYGEDVVVNKNLTIKVNNKDIVELKPVNTGFTIVDDVTGSGSGTSITGFIITLLSNGLGVNISADSCKIENNTIKGGNNGIITFGNNTIIKNNIIFDVKNTSIQAGFFSILNQSGNITIDTKTANNTLVDNNHITGGLSGIVIYGDNSTITKNKISHVLNVGIGTAGSYPTISGNKITDMIGSGSKIGITVGSLNLSGTTGLIMNENTLTNIRSIDNKTTGIDIFAMSMDAPLDDVLVWGNKISDLYGIIESTAMSVVTLALKGAISSLKVMDNTITHIVSKGINSTSTAISCLPMGFDGNNNTTESETLILAKNKITGIKSEDEGGQSVGISFIQIIQGNSSISENNISEIEADSMAVGLLAIGVDYTKFQSNMTINKNIITEISAANTTTGILAVNLGNTFLLHNNIFQLHSDKTRYITAQPIMGNLTIMGNNLEGSGKDIGIAVNGNNTTISYNRIVNFQYYIKNMNFFEIFEMNPLSDEDLRNYLHSQYGTNITEEQIDEIIVAYHKWMDYENSIPSHTNAPYNWYGTNSDPGSDKFLPGNGTINYKPWLILSIHANPSTIHVDQTSTITAEVYQDSAGGDHSANAYQFFSGPQVIFTTNLGNLGSKSITVPWVNGLATTILKGDEGPGITTVTATDYQTVPTNANILGAPEPPKTSHPDVIGMQDTGTPIIYILMVLILLLGGLVMSNKK